MCGKKESQISAAVVKGAFITRANIGRRDDASPAVEANPSKQKCGRGAITRGLLAQMVARGVHDPHRTWKAQLACSTNKFAFYGRSSHSPEVDNVFPDVPFFSRDPLKNVCLTYV